MNGDLAVDQISFDVFSAVCHPGGAGASVFKWSMWLKLSSRQDSVFCGKVKIKICKISNFTDVISLLCSLILL